MQVILDGNSTRTSKIYVQKKEAYEKLVSLGANRTIVKPLGYVYNFEKENGHSNNVLICTNSDRIEKLNELVVGMPNMKFHVCALTEMSQKLISFEKYDNVRLYPGCKASEILDLFNTCDYYLDINYENEIVDATKEAFLHNLLILGFNQTIHNRKYVLPNLVFDANAYQEMIGVILDASHLDLNLERQRKMAMTQNAQDYRNIQKGRVFMFSTFNTLMVIIVLEVICCLYSLVLAYMSDKKFGKILNFLLAAIWAIAAILNVVGFQGLE